MENKSFVNMIDEMVEELKTHKQENLTVALRPKTYKLVKRELRKQKRREKIKAFLKHIFRKKE